MGKPRVTKDTIRAMAALVGLEVSENKLEELLPQVRRMVDGMAGVECLSLQDVEPAITFQTDRQ